MFLTAGEVSWIGLIVVTQNVVGSLFNSHIFDFTQGWFYVFGVGVAGGLVLKSLPLARRGIDVAGAEALLTPHNGMG
jgi:O-antigen ligase